MNTTLDIYNEFKEKYLNGEFRISKDGIKTVEIQNAHFICDKDYILRKPNYDYAKREIKWYLNQSLNINDIPGDIPRIWKNCSDDEGYINSNYGWCIFSEENGFQFNNCLNALKNDKASRHGVMIYNRPNIWDDWNENGKHDFICTYSTQCFLNDRSDGIHLKYIVYMRSNDAVFGYNNNLFWHKWVRDHLSWYLKETYGNIICDDIEWNAGSIHVYERHFKYLN